VFRKKPAVDLMPEPAPDLIRSGSSAWNIGKAIAHDPAKCKQFTDKIIRHVKALARDRKIGARLADRAAWWI
jgi:hypothetical protein